MPTQTPEKWKLLASTLKRLSLGVLVGVLGLVIVASLASHKTYAATNSTLNFQAKLETNTGAIAADGSYNVEFNLYTASSGGASLWTEDHLVSGSTSVRVANGYMTVVLGSVTAFPTTINWDQNLYLGMTVRGTASCAFSACTPADSEMTPRLQLTASPYAFSAGKLSQLNGTNTSTLTIQGSATTAQNFVIPDQGAAGTFNLLTTTAASASYIQNQNSIQQAASNFWISGTGTAGALQAGTGGFTGSSFLSLTNGTATTYATPLGANLAAKIAIANYDPGAFNAVIYLGLTATANVSARGIGVADARTGAHQPSIAVLSPDEAHIAGLSWDGSNSDFLIKTSDSASSVSLAANGNEALKAYSNGVVSIGSATSASSQTDVLDVTGYAPAAATAGSGGNQSYALNVTGSAGQGTTATSGQSAGAGSTIVLQAGNGGTAAGTSTNGAGGNVVLQGGSVGTGGAGGVAGGVIVKTAVDNANVFQVRNSANVSIFGVNSSADQVYFGNASTDTGTITLYNSGNTNSVSILTNGTTASYSIVLPSTEGSTGQCLGVTNTVTTTETLGHNNCASSVGAINATSNANGATITSNVLSLTAADATNGGVVTNTTQTFAGSKTFAGLLTANAGLTTSGAAASINDSSNFNTSINGGTSTGTVNIGNSLAGAITLQSAGGVTVSGNLTAGTSAGTGKFTNNGSTVNAVDSLSLGISGAIGLNTATVDIYTNFAITATAGSLALTVPTPSLNLVFGRLIYVTNVSATNIFTLGGSPLRPGATATLIWANVNGTGTWTYAGADNASILNQTTQQTSANFNIDGSGTAGISIITPLVTTATATTLSLGTSVANAVSIGASGVTTTINGPLTSTGLMTGNAGISVATGVAGTIGAIIQGASAQTADLLNIRDSTAANLLRVDASGNEEHIGFVDTPAGGIGLTGNLLTYSEQFDNAVWARTTITAPTANTQVAPDGNTTAEQLVSTGASATDVQTYTTAVNGNYTFSVWLKASTGTQPVQLRVDSTGGTPTTGTAGSFTATTTWQRFSVTQNFTGSPSNIKPTIIMTNNAATVYAWGGQLVTGTSPLVYSRTVTNNLTGTLSGLVSNGSTFTNNGGTLNTAIAIGNLSSGGSIGTNTTPTGAPGTVDVATSFTVNQTTAAQTLTVPSPTNTAAGRVVYISNIGSVSFTLLSATMNTGVTATLLWNGTAWTFAGSDGSSILNQSATPGTAQAGANFNIGGTGIANAFQAGTFSSTNNVTLQAASGKDVTISPGAAGGGSGILNLAVNAATLNIGNNSNNTRTIAIGNTLGAQVQTVTLGNVGDGSVGNGASVTTVQGGTGAGAVSLITGNNGTTAGGINIGNTTGAFVQTINIGTNATASSTTNINLGSTVAGTTILQSAGGVTVSQNLTAGSAAGTGTFTNNGNTLNATTTQSTGGNTSITNLNSYTSFLLTATAINLTYTLPDPSPTTAGKLIYVSNASSGSNSFTLAPTHGSSVLLNPGSTTTLIWNGTAWTYAGADSSGLQAAYNNSTSGGTAEIILDGTRTGLDIQDATAGTLGASTPLFAVHGVGTATTLGTTLFSVTNNANAPLVGIGTNVASRALDVAVSNTAVTLPQVLIEQANAGGDAGIEFKNTATGTSFYVGQDTSNNSAFSIGSGGASQSSPSTISFVQAPSAAYQSGSAATIGPMSFSSNNTAGNTIVAATAWDASNSYTTATCADTKGNSYTTVITKKETGGNDYMAVCVATNIAAGANSVTVTFTGGSGGASSRYLSIHEYSGVKTVGSIDVTANNVGGTTSTATDALTSTTAATSQPGDLIFGFAYDTASPVSTLSAGTNAPSFTSRTTTVNTGPATASTITEDRVQSNAASTAAFFNSSAAGHTYGALMVALKAVTTQGDTFSSSLFTLSQSGAATFKNLADSTGALAIQNSTAATNIFNVDTANSRVGINLASGATATADLSFGVGDRTINILTQTATNTAGNILNINSGAGNGTGAGGAVNIQGGAGGATSGAGGTVTIKGGNATAGVSAGGSVVLQVGAASSTGAQGTVQIQNTVGASLFTADPSNTSSSLNLISNGGAETGAPPTGYTAVGTGASVAAGTGTDVASGTQSAKLTTGTSTNGGMKVAFTTAPTASTTVNYIASFSAKFVSGTAVSIGSGSPNFTIQYSPDNGTTFATCSNYTQAGTSLSSTTWTKISCSFIPGSTTVTTPLLYVRQSDTSSRVIDFDNLSVVQQNSAGTQDTGLIRIGGPTSQGLTLFQLDTYAGTPFTGANAALAGAMYFDTTAGKMQCYDGSVWGACGAAPNSNITLTPEYTGAALHGKAAAYGASDNNIGTLNSDFCANQTSVLVVGTLCNSGDARNFYSWTTVQPAYQSYGIYVTYKLPSTFKAFVGNTSLTGRVDNITNAGVNYSVFRSSGGTITQCGGTSAPTNVVGWDGTTAHATVNTWQSASINPATSCAFTANDYVIFRIDSVSQSSANAYVENLNFSYSNQ